MPVIEDMDYGQAIWRLLGAGDETIFAQIVSDIEAGKTIRTIGTTGAPGVIINVKDAPYNAAGDGSDDTLPILAAIAACPVGGTVHFPRGLYRFYGITVTKKIHFTGDGWYDSVLMPMDDEAEPLIALEVPPPEGDNNIYVRYGASIMDLAITMGSDNTTGTGIRVGTTCGWTKIRDVYIEFGAVSIDVQGANTYVQDCHLADSTRFLTISESGLELRLRDIVLEQTGLTGRPTEVAIDLDVTVGGGALGALYMDNVHQNNGGVVLAGFVATAPTNTSVPIKAVNCVFDNVAGPALSLTNIYDGAFTNCWFNGANGTGGAVRMQGGGRHRFTTNVLYGGLGAAGCSFDFAGGGTAGVSMVGNVPMTGPFYKMPASGEPTLLHYDDIDLYDGLVAISNDMVKLHAATTPRINPRSVVSVGGGQGGTVTLVAGTKVVANTTITADSKIRLDRQALVGTPGHLSVVLNPGVGLTINSSSSETSTVAWTRYEEGL